MGEDGNGVSVSGMVDRKDMDLHSAYAGKSKYQFSEYHNFHHVFVEGTERMGWSTRVNM